MSVYAEEPNSLCIHTKTGQQILFLLEDKPNVVINEDGVNITTFKNNVKYRVTYPLDNFSKFTLENVRTASVNDITTQSYKIENNVIKTKGTIFAYNPLGQLYSRSESGTMNLSSAPSGVYIIKTNNISFKYYKK